MVGIAREELHCGAKYTTEDIYVGKQELQHLEQLGVISHIEQPTEWCSRMVGAPKKSGDIRICVDLSPLNEPMCRETFILLSGDQTLGMLSGAKIFTKLDANMGF